MKNNLTEKESAQESKQDSPLLPKYEPHSTFTRYDMPESEVWSDMPSDGVVPPCGSESSDTDHELHTPRTISTAGSPKATPASNLTRTASAPLQSTQATVPNTGSNTRTTVPSSAARPSSITTTATTRLANTPTTATTRLTTATTRPSDPPPPTVKEVYAVIGVIEGILIVLSFLLTLLACATLGGSSLCDSWWGLPPALYLLWHATRALIIAMMKNPGDQYARPIFYALTPVVIVLYMMAMPRLCQVQGECAVGRGSGRGHH